MGDATFQILLALAEGPRHGYAILQEVAQAPGKTRLGPATLYRSLERLLEQGWVSETPAPRGEASRDERRRYYRLTAAGSAAARAEAERLAALVRQAAVRGLTASPARGRQ